MAQPNLGLWYKVDKNPTIFWISIPPNSKIAELKSTIRVHRKDGPLRELTTEILTSPHETVAECVQAMNLEKVAVELKNDNQKVSEAFPDTAEKILHLIVNIRKPSPPPIRSSTPWTLLDNEHVPASTIESLPHADEEALLIDAARLIDATRVWEEEKLELEGARDEALARADTADDLVKTLSDDLKAVRQCNVQYRIRILEQELQDAVVKEAKSKASKATSDATSSWESEKLELQKSRDEALARADAADASIRTLTRDVRFLREFNERFQLRVANLRSFRNRINLEHAAAVAEAERKASSAASDAARAWESQKLELERARDDAVARADEGDKQVKKLLLEDAAKCKDYQSKITELQSAIDRGRDAAAIEKASSANTSPTTEEPPTKHAQVTPLHAKVTALHAQVSPLHAKVAALHAETTALHELSLKVTEAATMAAKAEAAATVSDKSKQASLKAAADAAAVVTKAKVAAASNKSIQATSTKASIPARGAEPRASYFSQSDAVAADALRTIPASSAANRQVTTAPSAVSCGVPSLRSRVVRVAPRSVVGDYITRRAAPDPGGALLRAQDEISSTARASINGAPSKRSREEEVPEAVDDSLAKRLKPVATTTTSKRRVVIHRPPLSD
ncbi:hypothetical protein BDR03DRAFT_1015612 [Suillus americanus]|nr:hypothetical protein BDR03DRAFT_1015612 [Suillus americanus]